MQENINELIDINLKLLAESKFGKLFRIDFVDENNKRLRDSKRFAEILVKKNLIDLEPTKKMRCDITEYGFNIAQNGGWLNFISTQKAERKKAEQENREKENLELELAKSNLEANKLNKKIAKQNAKNEKNNRIATWINVVIGIINIGLLIWQILKNK
ncbi:hypothetical protein [Luteirhabdus pelagi]|uniref:hypothetical protein n=1 Tax=Luteirhabdus pelagi TaxID=2792783 RepID=UPI00193A1F11|nr:hypothetical protein [Luteirhabdus pelagi]